MNAPNAKPDLSDRARELIRQFRAMPKPEVFDLEQERENTKDAHVLTGIPANVMLDWVKVAGVHCIRLRPRKRQTDREVVFIHGGAFVLMSAMTHHRFAGHIANACQAEVLVPDYSLAPEAPFPKAIEECAAILRERRAQGPKDQILMGDSAGGGLALSTCCYMRDRGDALPDLMALMSPWLDLSLSDPSTQTTDDPLLSFPSLQASAALYLNGTALDHPLASPIYADLTGLPQTLVQSAGRDMLYSDSARLADRWGDGLTHQFFPDMIHSFQMFAGDMPEANMAIEDIAGFVHVHFPMS